MNISSKGVKRMYDYIQTSLVGLFRCETTTACRDFYIRWCDGLNRLSCFSHDEVMLGKQVMGNHVDKKIQEIIDNH